MSAAEAVGGYAGASDGERERESERWRGSVIKAPRTRNPSQVQRREEEEKETVESATAAGKAAFDVAAGA